jgi:hypothetical protein
LSGISTAASIRFESRVGNIETELRDIRQRLEALDEATRNASGFAKEIDHSSSASQRLKNTSASKRKSKPDHRLGSATLTRRSLVYVVYMRRNIKVMPRLLSH